MMMSAAPGAATESVRGHAPLAGSQDVPADPLVAALFDAALEIALGEIDAARSSRDDSPVVPPSDRAPPVRGECAGVRSGRDDHAGRLFGGDDRPVERFESGARVVDRAGCDDRAADRPGRDRHLHERVDSATAAGVDPWQAIAAWREALTHDAATLPAPPASPSAATFERAVGSPTTMAQTEAPGEPRRRLHDDAVVAGAWPLAADGGRKPEASVEVPVEAGVSGHDQSRLRDASPGPTKSSTAANDERPVSPSTERAAANAVPTVAPSLPDRVATSANASIAAPIGSPGFAPALAEQVVRLVALKWDRIELAVHPAELGPIGLSVAVNGSDVQVVVTAVQPDARAALNESLPDLRSALQEAGIALGDASVHDGRTSRDDRPTSPTPARDVDADDPPVAASRVFETRRGLVDLYV